MKRPIGGGDCRIRKDRGVAGEERRINREVGQEGGHQKSRSEKGNQFLLFTRRAEGGTKKQGLNPEKSARGLGLMGKVEQAAEVSNFKEA